MFRLIDSLLIALERLWQHRVLVLWVLVGLSAATTLALSVVLYVDAVNTRLLDSRLSNPPYAFRFRYLGSWEGNIGQTDVESASAAVQQGFVRAIGLNTAHNIRYVSSGIWTVQRAAQNGGTPLRGAFGLGILQGADAQMELAGGTWDPNAPYVEGEPIPVLMPEGLLYSAGLQIGDVVTAQRSGVGTVELEIVAMWRPVNRNDPAWIFIPSFFNEVLLLPPNAFWAMLEGQERPVEEVAWYLNFDGAAVRTSDVEALLGSSIAGQRAVLQVLPGIRLTDSPETNLRAFTDEVTRLRSQLVIILAPVAGLVLYFVSLVAGLLVARQNTEDVTLRSRGMSRRAIMLVHLLMWLLLAGMALGVGLFTAPYIVRLVGQTTSFLRFDDVSSQLQIVFTSEAFIAGSITALLAASSGLYMAWRSSAQTITSFKRTSARAQRAWWQRIYLDVMLLAPATYVLYTLSQQGGLTATATDPFSDPLAFVGPMLFSLGLTLLFLRVFPFVLRMLAGVVAMGRGVAILMALRELTRSAARYRGALLMMCFTLSLTGFTASMASTIDQSLADTIRYSTGADQVLITAVDAQTEQTGTTDTGQQELTVTGYNTLPVADLLQIDGVAAVSRVGRYQGRISIGSQRLEGTVLGVDRGAMAAVSYFRQDYADESLAALFNRLAGNRTGVLMSRQTMLDYNLLIGQEIGLEIYALGGWQQQVRVPIVGILDYFPTLDPAEGFFLLTNIDPLFEIAGTPLPHDIWISLYPGTDAEQVRAAARALGFPIIRYLDPQESLQAAQAAPSRRGVLGFLSVGFVASITLTLVTAIIQSAASFRAQASQLGVLRAMGAGGTTVGVYLLLLQSLASLSGVASGTLIGVATTVLFLPLLDFSGGLPPYLIRVAWTDIALVYAVFAGVLLSVMLLTTILLGRERLTTIVKLGDA